MTEKQYEKALQALGAENVTTERQRKNGISAATTSVHVVAA